MVDFSLSQNLNDCLISKWQRQIHSYNTSSNKFELVGHEFMFFNSSKVLMIDTDSTLNNLHDFLNYYKIINPNKLLISNGEEDWDEVPFSWVNCTEYEISIGNAKPHFFLKMEELPYALIQNLYQIDTINTENIFEDYLSMTVKSLCETRLDVFKEIEGIKVGYLIQGDLVEVLETQGDWSKVKYLKTDKEYWTYASCLK